MNKHRFSLLALIGFLLMSLNSFSQDQFIKTGDDWQYFDNGSLENNWFQNPDISKNWKTGISPIGYGDRKVKTNISYGKDSENKHAVKYFSKTITINEPEKYLAFGFQIKRDDGIVVYLNGKEVYRNNIPMISVTGNTFAAERVDGSRESEVLIATFDSEFVIKGKNIISVSVHQVAPDSSDCIFDLEMFGYTDPKMLSTIISDQTALNNQLENQIKSLNTNILLEKTALQLEIEQNRAENYKIILIVSCALWIFLLSVFFLVYNNGRKKDSDFKEKLDALADDLKKKDEELIIANTRVLHTRQYFKELKADLRGLKNTNDSVITDMIYHVNQALQSEVEWKTFNQHFDAVFDGFHNRLLDQHPTLSEVELRHCMFIKMHLQTKEIAKILLIDPRSVQTSRYRIKKKMELAEEVDLRNYLLNF